jgi:small subunit ribosomal protein S20
MANSMQAKKRVRQTARQTAVNRNRLSRVRRYVRKVEAAIDAGDKDAAALALREAQPEIMRGAKGGVLHRNTASRKVSRLAHRISKI